MAKLHRVTELSRAKAAANNLEDRTCQLHLTVFRKLLPMFGVCEEVDVRRIFNKAGRDQDACDELRLLATGTPMEFMHVSLGRCTLSQLVHKRRIEKTAVWDDFAQLFAVRREMPVTLAFRVFDMGVWILTTQDPPPEGGTEVEIRLPHLTDHDEGRIYPAASFVSVFTQQEPQEIDME